ncbi:MAG: hypothetical protein ACQEP1_05520 [Nanobdellota archaeon]
MEKVTIPKEKYELMKREIRTLRDSKLYKRLAEFESDIRKNGNYTRKDLGF